MRGHGSGVGTRVDALDSAKLAEGEILRLCWFVAANAIRGALDKAQRPVIMLGHGVSDKAVRDQLFTLARQWKIPVITSVLEMSALPWDDPLNFGCIGGAYGHRYANMIANAKSDLLICLGISLCTRQIGTKVHEFAKNAKIIRVDIDNYNLQRNIHENGIDEMKFCADAAEVIRAMAENAETMQGVQNLMVRWFMISVNGWLCAPI